MVDAVGAGCGASSVHGLKQQAESQQQTANVIEKAVETQKAEINAASTDSNPPSADPNLGQSVNTSA